MFIIDSIISGMMAIADVIWGWPILILTSFVAVYMTVRLRFFQFRHFGLIMKETFGKIFDKGSGEGNINPFKAACTALASTLGSAILPAYPSLLPPAVPVPYSGCGSSPCWASSSSSRK